MSGKEKKKGKGFLKTIKKGIDDTATSAALETEYLKGKNSGYPHPPEILEQLEICRGLKDEIPTLRGRFSDFSQYERTIAETEDKCGTEFKNMIDKPMQHPSLQNIYRLFGDYKSFSASKRFELQTTLETVKDEWKNLETTDIHNIRQKQDLANRACSDQHYWNKKSNAAQAKDKENKYRLYTAEVLNLIHELRMRKETVHPQYILRIVSAEAAFLRAIADRAEEVESQLREIGAVEPIMFHGVPGYSLNQQAEYMSNDAPIQTSFTQPLPSTPPLPQTPQSRSQTQARALYPFNASGPRELSFNPGDILTITTATGDWWEASMNGKVGLIPSNYVQIIS